MKKSTSASKVFSKVFTLKHWLICQGISLDVILLLFLNNPAQTIFQYRIYIVVDLYTDIRTYYW